MSESPKLKVQQKSSGSKARIFQPVNEELITPRYSKSKMECKKTVKQSLAILSLDELLQSAAAAAATGTSGEHQCQLYVNELINDQPPGPLKSQP